MLNKPRAPAVVLVQLPTVGQAFGEGNPNRGGFARTVEDVYGAFAAYYDTPYLSVRWGRGEAGCRLCARCFGRACVRGRVRVCLHACLFVRVHARLRAFEWAHVRVCGARTVEDVYGAFAAYYDTPYLSFRWGGRGGAGCVCVCLCVLVFVYVCESNCARAIESVLSPPAPPSP